MLLKSNEWLLVGYNDGARMIKYYYKKTHKILTSRNYHFMDNNNQLPPAPEYRQISFHMTITYTTNN